MGRRPDPNKKLMRRSTVDLPLMLSNQMREAAFDIAKYDAAPFNGMLQRFIEKAITHELEQTFDARGVAYWPVQVGEVRERRLTPAERLKRDMQANIDAGGTGLKGSIPDDPEVASEPQSEEGEPETYAGDDLI